MLYFSLLGSVTFKWLQSTFHIVFIHELFSYFDCLVGQEFFIMVLWFALEDEWVWGSLQVSQILIIIYVIYSLLYFFILLFIIASKELRLFFVVLDLGCLSVLGSLQGLFGLDGFQCSLKWWVFKVLFDCNFTSWIAIGILGVRVRLLETFHLLFSLFCSCLDVPLSHESSTLLRVSWNPG